MITARAISLREAIELSAAGGGRQKITFDDALAGETIVLESSLQIPCRMTIEGLGAGEITIQATDPTAGEINGDGFSVFDITDDDPEMVWEVMISGMMLTGSDSPTDGGAIFTEENLTLDDVHIHDNASAGRGGGIFSTGRLTTTGSTIEDNTAGGDGGGVHTVGGITLDSSTVSGNHSGDEGGGISVEGDNTEVVVQSSTISGNTAVGDGGGMQLFELNPRQPAGPE